MAHPSHSPLFHKPVQCSKQYNLKAAFYTGCSRYEYTKINSYIFVPKRRRKLNAESECLFAWEDVDEFNLEKGEK
jgi:hypothetical protein